MPISIRLATLAAALLVAIIGAACAHRPAKPTALLPSEAIAQAQALGADGSGERGLVLLTEALCRRAAGERRDAVGMSEEAAASVDVKMVNAWVSMWDLTGRPTGPRQAVAACYGKAPVSLLLAVALADASGDWQSAASLASQRNAVDEGGALRDRSRPLAAELAMRHAVALLHLGQHEAAIAELQADIAQFPEHLGLRVALAQSELADGNYAGVGEALWPILRQPAVPEASLLGRVRALMQAAREGAAPPMTPADSAEYADLTQLLASSDLSADDVAHVRHVASVSAQPQLYGYCALALLKEGDVVLARTLLERAKRALPLDPAPARLLAAHHMTADDYDAALAALLEAVRRDPFDAENQAMLAHVAERVGANAQLRASLEALVRLMPGDAEYHDRLARLRAKATP